MGVYRGLKLKTAGTEWDVRVERFTGDDLAVLKSMPAVLSLNLDTSDMPAHIDHGFHAEVGHSVVSLGSPGEDLLTIFDPSPDFGLEVWGRPLLKHVTSGVVLRLVPLGREIEKQANVLRNVALAQRSRWLAAGL